MSGYDNLPVTLAVSSHYRHVAKCFFFSHPSLSMIRTFLQLSDLLDDCGF